jgi:hypothetical protein
MVRVELLFGILKATEQEEEGRRRWEEEEKEKNRYGSVK